jgi:hypothetical protein
VNCRRIYAVIVSFLALVVFVGVANAQSKKIDSPTPLALNEISGIIDKNTKDDVYYYYSFWANPGDVKVTITVEPNLNIEYSGLTSVEVILVDSNSEVLVKKSVSPPSGAQQSSGVVQVQTTKRERLILGIKVPGGMSFDGIGKYKVRIDGDVEFGEQKGDPNQVVGKALDRDGNENGDCLPKQGTLMIKMKDGSKKIVDLSEAETITVVP